MIFTSGYDRQAVIAEFQQTPHIDKPVTVWSLASTLSHVRHGAVG
jgi:hypothetical protein